MNAGGEERIVHKAEPGNLLICRKARDRCESEFGIFLER